MGQVRLRIGDQTLTAVITADALAELKLRRGDEALAIVKSTEVMIAREAQAPEPQPGAAARAADPQNKFPGLSIFPGLVRRVDRRWRRPERTAGRSA